MKLLKINGKTLGVITDEKLAQTLHLDQALSPSGDPSDGPEIVDLASDFTDADTGMARSIENYEADGYVVDGVVMRHEQDKDVLMVILGDGRAYPLGVD
jgi:hypothetical protein